MGKTIPKVFGIAAAVALGAAGITLIPTADAATGSFAKGPAPSNSSIQAARGPFAIAESSVARASVSGFGGGDIYAPTDTSAGTFGAVVIAPGFTARKSSMAWLAPRLASQGFVVFNIDTLTTSDQPASRGRQLLAAADFLTRSSSAKAKIDPARVAVVGHSMGGGGALEAAQSRSSLKAAIPLTPWNLTKNFRQVQVPTLIVGAEADTIAPVRSFSTPFFESLPAAPGKAFLELNGASHFAPNTPNATISSMSISWLKVFVDGDTRYQQFICPGPGRGAAVEQYTATAC
ncbi:alpha/beta hydrolase family protein [Actinoplanes derwentensis]|uniref:Predicted dienelactone hydrolase n=1 Tax=Actinoplanes derwentensis TaxID=113562 RepID=A0A1H1UQ20_9ACTN|nr:dienelactone hydrolase family protein [Actinoplanes derwentensis]GID88132.1 lipase [Actinoplanes derwentensis]SDS74567.1 Predicted dienelactone hydrolase [Actinoplanes derwentensis]